MTGKLILFIAAIVSATSPLFAAEAVQDSSWLGRELAGRVAGEPVS